MTVSTPQLLVLHYAGCLARIGDSCEIYLGRVSVARGYLDEPTLPAARLLPDSYGEPGAAMYATGDLAHRSDGLLEFVGQSDNQAKIHGYRMEPREVEWILGCYPGVREAALLATGNDRLVALVVMQGRIAPKALRAFADSEMPHYIVAAAFATPREIPGNEHGKRNLPALTDLARQHLRGQPGRAPPSADAKAYPVFHGEELLAVKEAGTTDQVFALGGNSRLAFRAKRWIKCDLGIDIEVRQLLRLDELADLAGCMRKIETTERSRALTGRES